MLEIILALLLATCPACNHNGHIHNHVPNNGQVSTMGDETDDGGEGSHAPNYPPPPPLPSSSPSVNTIIQH
ncbi:hypothetical protein [Niabella hibiscisoli]|uniref:hypothetical protein n=1 Tax=Niabella hibiscisoli TaxID=1825928 RepID=UPI001F10D8B6|nr:hypothetical protein [Niabella hibiscisoli]MCH5718548.1 hypothetical protein [Niabella hibiscisoli]